MTRKRLLLERCWSGKTGAVFSNLKGHLSTAAFPDTIILYNESKDEIFIKAESVAIILSSLAFPWKVIGFILKGVPLIISNYFYDLTAKIRLRFFEKPKNICPIVSQKFKNFFIIED